MITIVPNVFGTITKDSPLSIVLAGAGGTAPYTFSLVIGALPTGLSLAPDGTLSGTPTAAGTYSFTVRATDSVSASGDQPYNLRVQPPVYWYICTRASQTPLLPTVAADQRDHNRKVANALENLTKSRHKVGDVQPRPTLKDIPDHLLCDGSAIARASFPQLFAEIGTEWGEGDGTTTFNIPNLIGEALPVPLIAPAQVVTPTTVATAGSVVTQPTTPAQTGGTSGGNVNTGGRNEYENIP